MEHDDGDEEQQPCNEDDEFEEDAVMSSLQHEQQQQQQHLRQQPPESASSPIITNHFDAVLECLDFLRVVEDDEQVEKQEVVHALRSRLHNMLSKILMGNTVTSMSMLGWRLE